MPRLMLRFASVSQMVTTRRESGNGSGFSKIPLTTLKITTFAPMPIARVNIATTAKPGFRRSVRAPYRRSCQSVPIRIAPKKRQSNGLSYCSVTICPLLRVVPPAHQPANRKQRFPGHHRAPTTATKCARRSVTPHFCCLHLRCSFVTQGDHRIHTRGPPRREVGRQQRDGAEQHGDRHNRHGISWFHTI